MTARARKVLDDCRVALQLLEEETDLQRWRIHWVAALALVRAVGHVLEKVDGADAAISGIANAAYKRWKSTAPEHEIFRQFIERERNIMLKEYEFNTHPLEEVRVLVQTQVQRVSDGRPGELSGVFPIGDNIYRPLLDGFREGDDARDVLSDAIDWWESELSGIERALEGKRANP
jgi:hypothetical protein